MKRLVSFSFIVVMFFYLPLTSVWCQKENGVSTVHFCFEPCAIFGHKNQKIKRGVYQKREKQEGSLVISFVLRVGDAFLCSSA